MAKFSGSVAQPGQVSAAEQELIATAPVQQLQEATPQAAPVAPTEASLSEFLQSTPEATPEDVASGIEEGIAAEAQIESERIPTLRERGEDRTTVHRWDPLKSQEVPQVDGGLKQRAAHLADVFSEPSEIGNLRLTPVQKAARDIARGTGEGSIADIEGEAREGSLIAAFNRTGAVTNTTSQTPEGTTKFHSVVDPLMLQVGSAVTENVFSEAAFGEQQEGIEKIDESRKNPTVSKAQGNAALGQQINREYARMRNQAEGRPTDDYDDLPHKEAVTLGDAFKEMWAAVNPDLVHKSRADDGQTYFQLNAAGIEALDKGRTDRARLFPPKNVRPSKTPTATGQLPGETGRTLTKKKTGRVKEPLVGAKTLIKATQNLNKVPNVVDRRREKILYMTALPVLKGDMQWDTWQATINNMGADHMPKFQAAQRKDEQRQKPRGYNAENEMLSLRKNIAQNIRAIASERNGANYLTYQIQAFTGRVEPQQTYFNPTTSKAVRFVTRNAVPAKAAPGSRVEKNLRQMYAMMLVDGADAALPAERDRMLTAAIPKLAAWGKRLEEIIDERMTDDQLDQIAEAIKQGIPLTDPNFPQFQALTLDPLQDKDLITAINKKGEDGPHFIDGLIDLYHYNKARMEGRTHPSYFNAYVDGKTNGIASAGIQMGSEQVAYATGVLRNNTSQLLDDGDIRDQLQKTLIENMDDGFDGSLGNEAPLYYSVAKTVYGYRPLNKTMTMTFGYGKDIENFDKDINEAIDLLYEQALADPESDFNVAVDSIDRSKLVDIMIRQYGRGMAEVLSEDALKSRAIMRSAAMLHSITDQLFSITSATGFQLNIGGQETLGYDAGTAVKYKIDTPEGQVQTAAGQFETKATAAAIKRKKDEETGQVTISPGGFAYGGSVTAPVQSLDAATVAMSVVDKSWDKLKAASNGNPYVHTIYDAFKFDAMGFDVGVAEVNKNWLDAGMNWSYLQETYDATQEKMTDWFSKTKQLDQNQTVDTTLKGGYRMAGWLLSMGETNAGKPWVAKQLHKQFMSLLEMDYAEAKEATKNVTEKVARAGVNLSGDVDQMTVGQIRVFVKAMVDELKVSSRLSTAITNTNNNKKRLKKKIDAQKVHKGNEVLQYYAH